MQVTTKHYIILVTLIAAWILAILIYFGISVSEDDYVPHDKPHIVVIIADDVGWNDVSFHGSNQIPTPNIDALGYNGIFLDRFYTQSTCTPSRTAFLTGNYPIRSGMQGTPLRAGENRALPLDMPTLPERLKGLGYKNHLVGKWHLGAARRNNTPTARGFDSHYGYWNGFIGYFKHFALQEMTDNTTMTGLDFFDGFVPQWDAEGEYATELFTERSLKVIEEHNETEPLFLMVAHLAAHTGEGGSELGVANLTENDRRFGYIEDELRRRFAGVITTMDDSVGRIVAKLQEKDMLKKSVILFFSDNGGQTVGEYQNAASNYPFKGLKFTEFEGGIRTPAVIYSPLFKERGYINEDLVHVSDWLPTFYRAAGGGVHHLGPIDGIDHWHSLGYNYDKRFDLITNINEAINYSGIISHHGKYKLVQGSCPTRSYEEFYGEDGRGPEVAPFDPTTILQSRAHLAIQQLHQSHLSEGFIEDLRRQLDKSKCRDRNFTPSIYCSPTPCLFNLEDDPCETRNVINEEPAIAQILMNRLLKYRGQLVPQKNVPADPEANPIYYNNTWCTWLDGENCSKTLGG